MEKPELKKIIDGLKGCIDNGDTEIAHGSADSLLVDALQNCIQEQWTTKEVQRVVDLYDNVEKWYA